jgi:uncharacterized peroxidase-related enzyme
MFSNPPAHRRSQPRKRKDQGKYTHLNRITQVDPTQAVGNTKKLFERVGAKLGAVPNLFRVLGNSPAALKGYLNFDSALAAGNFDVKVREQIALTVAESNLCSYCLSAHAFSGEKVGLTEKDIADAIHATSTIGRLDAILKLARSIVVQRGEVSDSDLERARIFGLTDSEIVETVANVVLNILTNYVNHVARTLVDFPEVRPGQI